MHGHWEWAVPDPSLFEPLTQTQPMIPPRSTRPIDLPDHLADLKRIASRGMTATKEDAELIRDVRHVAAESVEHD